MGEIAIYTHAQPLTVKEYHGERVITFKDMDTLHQRPEGTARRNFNANRGRFIEGEDFFIVKPADIQMDEIRTSEINNRGTVLLTKMGYLMLVKSFTDDLAWTVQRQLVKSYFEAHPVEPPTPAPALPEMEHGTIIRSIPKAVEYIRQRDPESCVSVCVLRRWVKEGKVPSRKTGKNFLVNMADIEEFLAGR